MNLLITDSCNRACPYCFAQEKVTLRDNLAGATADFIPLDNVQTYLDFMAASDYPVLRLLGGEPTMHPRFAEIVDMGLAQAKQVMIFTNALWSKRVLEYLAQEKTQDRVRFVVNVHEAKERYGRESEKIEQALAVAGARAVLSFNVYHTDFDFRFTADLIDRFGLRRAVRLGLSSPIVGKANASPAGRALNKIGARMFEQMRDLKARDIRIELDCGWQLCMFPQAQLSRALAAGDALMAKCGTILDVSPDLTVWPCFPLSGLLNVRLTDFNNRHELIRYYDQAFRYVRRLGTTDHCVACGFGQEGKCSGGCMARSIRDFMAADPDLTDKLERNVGFKAPAAARPA